MKTRRLKVAAGAAGGTVLALSSLATIAPAPAGAAGVLTHVVVHKYFTTGFEAFISQDRGVGASISVHASAANPNEVFLDSNYPIVNESSIFDPAYDCYLSTDGNAVYPYHADCKGATDNSVSLFGSSAPDTMRVSTPGKVAFMYGYGGADNLAGSNQERDVIDAGYGADTITVNQAFDGNVDSVQCGSSNGTADGATDTVYYNGPDALHNCAQDTKVYSNKA